MSHLQDDARNTVSDEGNDSTCSSANVTQLSNGQITKQAHVSEHEPHESPPIHARDRKKLSINEMYDMLCDETTKSAKLLPTHPSEFA